jgi:hypothetical protein
VRTLDSGYGVHPQTDSDSLAFWPLDEGSGAAAYDLIGGRTLSNPAALWTLGLIGRGVGFAATHISTTGVAGADAAALQAQWSCEVWIKVSAVPGSVATILEYSNPAGGAAADNIQMSVLLNTDLTLAWKWEGAAVNTQNTTAKVRVGVWQHVAVTKQDDGAGAFTVTTWLNGVADNIQTSVPTATGGSAGQWHMGGGHGQFVGAICSAHVSDAAFNSTHIVQSWRRGMLWRDPSGAGHGISELQVTVFPSWAGGSGYALTSYINTFDFVESVSITESVDQQCATAQLGLKRSVYDISLAPLMENSMANQNPQPSVSHPGPASSTFAALLHINAPVIIYARRRAAGVADDPTSAGAPIFVGTIDEIDWGGETIAIDCRDSGKALIDTYIETEAEYNVGADASIEVTIQNILNAASAGVTLYTPTSPSFNLGEFKQRRESLMTASQTLADQIGWVSRYRFDPLTSSYRFTLYDVERSRSRFDGVIAVSDYSDFGSIKQSITDVRNAVRVCYRDKNGDASGVDDNGNPIYPPADVIRTNPASITAYGRRFMEISDAACPNIDEQAEAEAMADAILADLVTPQVFMELEVPYWEIELQDRLKFEENTRTFDTAQTFAVIGKQITFREGVGSTQLQLKETPASGVNKHLTKEAGPGRALPPVTDVTDSPTDFGVRGRYAPLELLVQDADLLQNPNTLAGVQNPGFLVHPRGVHGVPTGWNHGSGTWGSGGDVYFTGSANSGDRAITLINVGAQIQSRWMPVIGGRVYEGRVVWTGAGGADELAGSIELYNGSRVKRVTTALFSDVVTAAGSWQTSRGIAATDPSDRWARVVLEKAAGPPITVDRVSINCMLEGFQATLTAIPTAQSAGTSTLVWNSESFDFGGVYATATGIYTVLEPGFHRFHTYVAMAPTVTNALTGAAIDMKATIPAVGTVTLWSSNFFPASGVNFGEIWLHTPPTDLPAGTTVISTLTVPVDVNITASSGAGGRSLMADR